MQKKTDAIAFKFVTTLATAYAGSTGIGNRVIVVIVFVGDRRPFRRPEVERYATARIGLR